MYKTFVIFFLMGLVLTPQAQKLRGRVLIDKEKKIYLDKTEITVNQWFEYYTDIKSRYSEQTAQYSLSVPDTALFRQIYGFSFFGYLDSTEIPTVKKERKILQKKVATLPMSCFTHRQAMAFCQWLTQKVNKELKSQKKTYQLTFSLPTVADYQNAFSRAKITQNVPLSPCVKGSKIMGLTDNVSEYSSDFQQIICGVENKTIKTTSSTAQPIGFRCKIQLTEE
ncbi:MAG: SUMF1/EgtB/PvdO family nonheme iron enzyme [Bacteroidales bacterium]|jgi:hypothetical protein|nr:SUMF1/EgtB/PvdO family nonheme iron enzyme [Bacteroidales bacterium]